jgi:hypothetical protein
MTNDESPVWLAKLLEGPLYRPRRAAVPLARHGQSAPEAAESADSPAAVPVEGAFRNGVLVLHNAAPFAEGSPLRVLLGKILEAVGKPLDQAGCVQAQEWPEPSLDALAACRPQYLLCFGDATPEIARMPLYQPVAHGECQVLRAHPLAELASNVALKKQLWTALQGLFGSK